MPAIARTGTLVSLALLAAALQAMAQDATWRSNPGSGDFNAAANWTPATVPTGTAFFGTSNTAALSFSADTTIGGWTFNADASNYSFSNGFGHRVVFNGTGIVISGGSATITNNGDLLLFAQGTTPGSAIIINNAGHTNFLNTAGNAVITNNAAGTVLLGEFATAGNALITNNGLLQFQDFSTAGNAAITNNGILNFVDTSTGGNAGIINGSAGVVDVSDSAGPHSDFKLSAGSIAGGGNFYLGSSQLTVGGNNLSTVVTGVISDCGTEGVACLRAGALGGSLVKTGTGTLTLSGNNTYTGTTEVNAGTLSVNGSIGASSLTTVNAGATLGGNGTVGNTVINGGTLAPGNSIGTLTVQGSLVFTAASSYMVEVSPSGADRTNVTGAAALGGATVSASFATGTYVIKQYTIVSAGGGVIGTFGSLVNTNLPSGFHSSLSYGGNNAYLDLVLDYSPVAGLNGNQQKVGNALTDFFNSNGTIPIVFGSLTPAGLTQASGETATGAQQTTFNAMTQFLGALLDPFIGGRGDVSASATGAAPFAEEDDAASAYASRGHKRSGSERDAHGMMTKAAPRNPVFDPRWSVWTAGFGGSQSTDGNVVAGSNGTTSRIFGAAVGADYLFSPRTIAGFALAGGGTSFSVANGGSGRSDLFQAGAFVRHTVGNAYISGALAYGWQDITTDRTVTIAGVDRLRAEFNANAFSGRVDGGYRFVAPWTGGVGITPYAAGQFTTFELPAYAEAVVSGANTFALAYGAKSVTASRSELGLRADKSFAMQNAILTLRGRAAWAHDFNADRNIAATFQTLPGASFVVNGAAQGRDAALTMASAEMKWLNGFSLAAAFEGEFSAVTRSYAGKCVARYAW